MDSEKDIELADLRDPKFRAMTNALASPTGQSSPPVERQQKAVQALKAQALMAREQREPQPPIQERKRKSPEEAGDDPN
jgi:hypothetical protein